MSLETGARLGPYEIESIIGVGGMGEVYKARDTRLDRIVAIKVLAEAVAADPQFRERFDREARTISQLSHPNICTLYDVGDGFLVMEYLEGETLAARLERGPLSLDETLLVASEISSALDRAHSAGIVHRDLKPGNVMLARGAGKGAPQAKLLDFGLAKQAASAVTGPGGSIIPVAASGALTAQGLIVGTFQYMAPEQLEGTEADSRADIFAFGAILFEMITGRKAFQGKTQVSLISAILKDEPPPIATLAPVAPKALDRIVRACLAKDPDARPRHMHDLLMQLTWIAEADPAELQQGAPRSPVAPAPVVVHHRPRDPVAWGLVAALAVALAGGAFYAAPRLRRAPAAEQPVQFIVPAPENSVFSGQVPTFAVSPDGRHIVFAATTSGPARLYLRSLATVTVKALPGTEGVSYPFWSPDSRFVAFFASGKLRKVAIAGGSPVDICDAPNGRGGTWAAGDVIVFAPAPGGALERVAATGGAPTAATTLDAARHDTVHRWPQFLPDGQHFLFLAATSAQPPLEIRVGAIDSRDTTALVAADSMGVFASGHLFFWRDGKEMARPFDPDTRQFKGDPFVVGDQVGQYLGFTSFSASTNGVIAYARGGARPVSQLTWMDRSGKPLGTVAEPGDYFNIALSPDEKRVAVTLLTGAPENRDVWLIDIGRSVSSRLTSDPANDLLPTWSPDGSRIIFGSTRQPIGIYTRGAGGGGKDELLLQGEEGTNPIDWSRDGRFILYFVQTPGSGFKLGVLPTEGDKKPYPLTETAFNSDHGAFSPDVKWVAYTSNESGREDVYVQAFPGKGGSYRVSRNGGTQPMWRGDGRELFFLAPDSTMMAVAISAANGFEAGIPQALFASGAVNFTGNRRQYAVTRDGQRFLINLPQQRATPTPLTVVVNWQAAALR
jgi:eukaryotic-like serine/threonine-protein kinase